MTKDLSGESLKGFDFFNYEAILSDSRLTFDEIERRVKDKTFNTDYNEP